MFQYDGTKEPRKLLDSLCLRIASESNCFLPGNEENTV